MCNTSSIFTFDIVKSNIFARLHNFPPLVDKSHPDSEVEDDVKKEINENLKLKMMSKKKKRKPEVEDDVEKEINENLKLKMMSKNK